MIRKPNPKVIGAFVTGAVVLLFGMIFFFSSLSLFSRNEQFILFFDQSVNGLTVGSSVKFRGVPIGAVERIMIRVEGQHPDSTAIPVIIKINHDRLDRYLGGIGRTFEPEAIMSAIRRGLFAQLTLESLITGQLFIEFTMDPERSPGMQWHLVGDNEMVEIPTLSGSLDKITADAVEIIGEFRKIEFGELGENLNQVLEDLHLTLRGLDTEAISLSVIEAADSVTAFVDSEEFTNTFVQMDRALAQVTETLETYHLGEGPLSTALTEWTESITSAMNGLSSLTSNLSLITDPEGSTRDDFQTMMRELGRAAKSIRTLADYLERNPNALLTGRPE